MTINENLTQYAGKPVADFSLADTEFDVDKNTPRLRLEYDDYDAGATIPQLLAAYAKLPEAIRTQALVIGIWGYEGSGLDRSRRSAGGLSRPAARAARPVPRRHHLRRKRDFLDQPERPFRPLAVLSQA